MRSFVCSIQRRGHRAGSVAFVAAMLVAATAVALPAHAQGIRYTLTPSVDYVRWDDALGLEDTYLYGGRVSFDFGNLVSFQPFFFTRPDVRADPAEIEDGAAFAGLAAHDVDVRHLGANLQLNLGTGSLTPFLRAGGGVLRFDPEGGDRTDQISLLVGGGVRFDVVGRVGVELFAEDLAFRVNRFRLYAPTIGDAPAAADPEADDLRHNVVVGAGVNVPLGGGFSEVSTLSGLRGVAIPVEPFVGRLGYDDDVGLDDQYLLGVRTGLDFNRYFGLRGYYWRGVNDDFDGTDPVQSYGGEAQFNLNSGPGVSPYLVAGAGRIDYGDDFRNAQGVASGDRTALILGGGVSLGLSERLRLNVSARDYVFDQNEEFEDVRNIDNLLHNPLLSAGLTFHLGGRTPTARDLRSPEVERLRRETERLRAENARLREAREDRDDEIEEERVDTVFVDEEGEQIRRVERRRIRDGNVSDRVVEVLVPATGELYIRYGEPGGVRIREESAGDASLDVSAAEIREVIREEVRREELTDRRGERLDERELDALEDRLAERVERSLDRRLLRGRVLEREVAPTVVVPERDVEVLAPALEARLDRIERRLDARLDALIQQRVREELRRRPVTPAGAPAGQQRVIREWIIPLGDTLSGHAGDTTIVTDTVVPVGDPYVTPATPVAETEPVVLSPAPAFLGVRGLQPYVGLSIDPTQAVAGLRLDAGPLPLGLPLHLVPEAAFGFGEGDRSILVAANLRYSFGPVFPAYGLSPYLLAGAGILDAEDTSGVLNVGAGLATDISGSPFGRTVGFLEYQGVDLFDQHRILAGLRLGF